ncbi:baseplate J/gp47 family protein [Lactobacillus sp. HT06-2]|uniref:baseplate J/gp47 family protein n=1 Tax=Lactobacillus sp. HT06-2 TaxID=2080222 RepID=UPI000CD9D429|nr:baseplate J/gp47 family protein [Lactobacillus sp. HT06-2]
MAINFGLTSRGFSAPSYDELLDSVESDFVDRWGEDLVLTSNSNAGIIARIIAWREYLLIKELERDYFSAFISTATDSSLDRLGANIDLPRKVARHSHADIVIQTDGEYLIEAGEGFETPDGVTFTLTGDVITSQDSDGNWTGIGEVESDEKGVYNNVDANTITLVSNPDENILSVTNPKKAEDGQDYEEDPAYRARLIMENAHRPGPTAAGIKSALLNLPGVRDANPIENPDPDVDKYGNPPYSVHVFVLGGRDEDIANCLVNHIAAGITLVGKTMLKVTDATGNKRAIYFDHAVDKQVYVKVNLTTNERWNEDTGVQQVKDAIREKINNLKMGKAVHLTRLYPEVYHIDGVEDCQIAIGTVKDQLLDKDILTKEYEDPTTSDDDIEVNIYGL